MGVLTEAGLDEVVAAGCKACGGRRLVFRAYLDGALPVLGGEPVGKVRWVYDGEKFVDGVFEVSCDACKAVVLADDMCPRCHAPGGLAKALAATNAFRVPVACPACESDELVLVAMIPARVAYEGGRAEAPKTHVELYDAGFHGVAARCGDCGVIAEVAEGTCPLCDAAGPLRERP